MTRHHKITKAQVIKLLGREELKNALRSRPIGYYGELCRLFSGARLYVRDAHAHRLERYSVCGYGDGTDVKRVFELLKSREKQSA